MKNYKISYLRPHEKPILLKIWKAQGNNFGIPYNNDIDYLIRNNQFLCIKDNHCIIAICAYKYMRNEIRLMHMWTAYKYRGQNLQIKLICKIINDTNNINLPFTVTCRKGADNNSFHQKLAIREAEEIKKITCDLLKFTYDKNKILQREEKL